MATQWDRDRLAKYEALVIAYEDAITAVVEGGVAQYTLDTGQSRQTVTKLDISSLTNKLKSFLTLRDIYYARCNGGSSYMRPAW